jgi:hypothetical protein
VTTDIQEGTISEFFSVDFGVIRLTNRNNQPGTGA